MFKILREILKIEGVFLRFIDTHTHIFPENLAKRSLETLVDKLPKELQEQLPTSDGTKQGLLESMKKAGIDMSIVLPVVTNPKHFDTVNNWARELNEENGKIISFGGIHPDNENIEEKLEFIKSRGFKGIKIHPDYQSVFIDDERYIKIIKKCIELELFVVTHAGLDAGLPDTIHCPPNRVLNMLNAVYGETVPEKPFIILAHLGGCEMYEEVYEKLCQKSVILDTAFSLDKIDVDLFLKIVRKHGAKNILFATDCPWGSQKEFVDYFKTLPLDEEEKDLISHKNAQRLFGL